LSLITRKWGWIVRSRFRTHLRTCQRCGVDTAILAVSLIASAYLMAFVAMAGGRPWVSWYALLPLFVAIRVCRPSAALMAGAFWGGCLYNFASSIGASVSPGLVPLLVLLAVPALYGYLGARLTRWIGFSPFVLGVGWVGVEFALAPLGLRAGVLGVAESDASLLHWAATALGYVHVALIAALVNAYLVSILSHVRVRVPQACRALGRRYRRTLLLPQEVLNSSLLFIKVTRPRGPPMCSELAYNVA